MLYYVLVVASCPSVTIAVTDFFLFVILAKKVLRSGILILGRLYSFSLGMLEVAECLADPIEERVFPMHVCAQQPQLALRTVHERDRHTQTTQ